MSWDAAAHWLMATSRPGTFHGPAPATPDGSDIGPQSDDDAETPYLIDWTRRVERGELDGIGA